MLIFHSAALNTNLFQVIFKFYFRYFPAQPSVIQVLLLVSIVTSLEKGALSNDLKGVVAKSFPGANPQTTIFARVWYQDPKYDVPSDSSDHWARLDWSDQISSQEDCPFLVVYLDPIPLGHL